MNPASDETPQEPSAAPSQSGPSGPPPEDPETAEWSDSLKQRYQELQQEDVDLILR
jgi:hypothetical protein